MKPWLRELVEEVVPHPEVGGVGTQLLERMVRVEEELKAQRALMDERFAFVASRFEALDKRFDESISQTNARFRESISQTNAHFQESISQTNARFQESISQAGKRFEDLTGQTNARFETADKRFEELIGQVNARFETVDKRFEESRAHLDSRFKMLTWMIGVGFAVVTSLTTLFALLA